jgi:hypothetical protein
MNRKLNKRNNKDKLKSNKIRINCINKNRVKVKNFEIE